MVSELRLIGVTGLREVAPGSDLAELIVHAAEGQKLSFVRGDIIVVTQKIVSKAEGRTVDLRTITPSPFAEEIARVQQRDPRLVEVVLRESRRVVKMDQRAINVETRRGFVCANAGVDESNVGDHLVTLLPNDPDESARRLRTSLRERVGVDLAVIVSDTFARPWREGFVNVAIGVAGLKPLKDYRGVRDTAGRVLNATILAVADELASAAELVMGKVDRVPVALVRGWRPEALPGTGRELIRPPELDLFR